MIQEVLQQASTVTAAASQLDLRSEIQFWFTIIGSLLAFVLGGIKVREWWISRRANWLKLLAPKLREIRALIHSSNFVDASDFYQREIHGMGFESMLTRISSPVDRDRHLPSLFFRFGILAPWYSRTLQGPGGNWCGIRQCPPDEKCDESGLHYYRKPSSSPLPSG